VRQARESRAGLQAWFGNQWMESGAASAVEQSQQSMRGHIRHTFRRLRQDAWDALEQRLDPQPAHQRGGQRGGGYYAAPGEGTINHVWEAFFNQMMTSMDSALCDGWIVQDDLSEPFIQLGMPALAIVEIALQSRDNLGVCPRSVPAVGRMCCACSREHDAFYRHRASGSTNMTNLMRKMNGK
jgi:hypothetical protein